MSDRDDADPSRRPIERGFPIERVNDLADREGRAKLHYRPLSTMHRWWATQLGSVFRAISLYTLVDDPERVTVTDPSADGSAASLDEFGTAADDTATDGLADRIAAVDLSSPDALWDLYPRDVRVEGVDVLDPFAGSGTSLREAVRFGARVTGVDLNPVATFLTERSLTAHAADADDLAAAYDTVRERVADELRARYTTQCPNDDDHTADVVYGLWVRCLDCTSCGETVRLFKDYRVASGRYDDSDRDVVYCPDCEGLFTTDDYDTPAVCPDCRHEFRPSAGPVTAGNYGCPACGLQYPMVDAVADGQSYDDHLYALEYYCPDCEDAGADRREYKGYRSATDEDRERVTAAAAALAADETLDDYLPTGEIPEGAVTAASRISGNDLFQHGYESWRELFNPRQQYCLATLLSAIDDVADQTAREYLLTAFSDSLAFQSTLSVYNQHGGKVESVFRRNSFTPRVEYAENNVWGARAGRGTFSNSWQKVRDAVAHASAPTERHLVDDETVETAPFDHPVGGDFDLTTGDFRSVDLDGEYDVVLTDPPYYDNVVYSELSDFYYVWLRLVLADDRPAFRPDHTPRTEAVVSNPATDTDAAGFEARLGESFQRVRDLLADDGLLVFTYRHGGVSEWSRLVETLCEADFTPTAVYPISANYREFDAGNAAFTVVVVARPGQSSEPISWPRLRRRIHSTVGETRAAVHEGQTVSEGDAGVVALGRCLRAYARHYGRVRRDGDRMSTEAVVERIFEAVAGSVSPTDVYLSLLAMDDPTPADVTRLCRGTDVDPAQLEARALIDRDGGLELATWETPARRQFVRECPATERTALASLHDACLGHDDPTVDPPAVTGEMLDLASELASLTGDDTYRAVVEA